MPEQFAPCGWDATPCEDCCESALDTLGEEARQALAAHASWFLWVATGRQFGLCETALRPCRRECWSSWGGLPFPTRIEGAWVNLTCGSCRGSCGCSVLSEFAAENVESIVDIRIDGNELPPLSTAQVVDRRRVVRIDGGAWPLCQDLGAGDDEGGTWSVTVMQGKPVPPGGELMAGMLLCELAKACASDDSCRLPQRIQTITRQGVTVGFQDQFENLDQLRTGILEIDMWIVAARSNAYGPAVITSPDVPRPSVVTWPIPGESGESS